MIKTQIEFKLPKQREVIAGDTSISIKQHTHLTGDLTLKASDGPLGIREYENPSYLQVIFDFEVDGMPLRYSGIITQWNLWAPSGSRVQIEYTNFEEQIGPIEGMMDMREDWSYILPNGKTHTNRLKYTSCKFWVMLLPASFMVRCDYFDQNPEIADMRTIFYSRPFEELILLKDTKIFLDENGIPEDYDPHSGDSITLLKQDVNQSR